MKQCKVVDGFIAASVVLAASCIHSPAQNFLQWAQKPPMGWNSWDCFATTVTEAQTKAQADVMAEKLASHGWEYVVVDIQWYEPDAKSFAYRKNAALIMDDYGRLLPATNRFPSAVNGAGFKPLADYVHGKGLKFGIHLMRGIPRQAVRTNTAVKGTTFHAADIANTNSICPWNPDMFGVDMTKPGAQDYYNSVFELIASWDVDFVKVDDLSRPYTRNKPEVEAIRKAIDHTGRPMVLSLSPGETPVAEGEHVMRHANMWRISDDFWDKWEELLRQFTRLRNWTPYRAPGAFPDADMLPLGTIDMGKRKTHFKPDEQTTLMTLWCIARSPLIFGGDLTKLDDFTRSLITNDEVLAVNQNSAGNRELFNRDGFIAWVADAPGSKEKYLALFNTRNVPGGTTTVPAEKIPVNLADLGFSEGCRVRDLWSKKDMGEFKGEFAPEVPWHGAALYRVGVSK
jgi:alpha-galactosidase